MAKWVKEHPDQAMLFRYEYLLDRQTLPQHVAAALEFHGLSPCPEVCEHLLAHRYHPTSGGAEGGEWKQAGAREEQALGSRAHDKWRNWSHSQQECFIGFCAEGMKELGYEIPQPSDQTA